MNPKTSTFIPCFLPEYKKQIFQNALKIKSESQECLQDFSQKDYNNLLAQFEKNNNYL